MLKVFIQWSKAQIDKGGEETEEGRGERERVSKAVSLNSNHLAALLENLSIMPGSTDSPPQDYSDDGANCGDILHLLVPLRNHVHEIPLQLQHVRAGLRLPHQQQHHCQHHKSSPNLPAVRQGSDTNLKIHKIFFSLTILNSVWLTTLRLNCILLRYPCFTPHY